MNQHWLEEYETMKAQAVKEACDWQDVLVSHATDEQAKINSKTVALIYEYFDSNDNQHNYYADPKEILKYLWNRGLYIKEMREDSTIPLEAPK